MANQSLRDLQHFISALDLPGFEFTTHHAICLDVGRPHEEKANDHRDYNNHNGLLGLGHVFPCGLDSSD